MPGIGAVRVRVGLHCGPVTGGIIGQTRRFYRMFGDTGAWAAIRAYCCRCLTAPPLFTPLVNVASRMMSTGAEGRVHASMAVAAALRSRPHPRCLLRPPSPVAVVPRGETFVKGKGLLETFWLEQLSEGATTALVERPNPGLYLPSAPAQASGSSGLPNNAETLSTHFSTQSIFRAHKLSAVVPLPSPPCGTPEPTASGSLRLPPVRGGSDTFFNSVLRDSLRSARMQHADRLARAYISSVVSSAPTEAATLTRGGSFLNVIDPMQVARHRPGAADAAPVIAHVERGGLVDPSPALSVVMIPLTERTGDLDATSDSSIFGPSIAPFTPMAHDKSSRATGDTSSRLTHAGSVLSHGGDSSGPTIPGSPSLSSYRSISGLPASEGAARQDPIQPISLGVSAANRSLAAPRSAANTVLGAPRSIRDRILTTVPEETTSASLSWVRIAAKALCRNKPLRSSSSSESQTLVLARSLHRQHLGRHGDVAHGSSHSSHVSDSPPGRRNSRASVPSMFGTDATADPAAAPHVMQPGIRDIEANISPIASVADKNAAAEEDASSSPVPDSWAGSVRRLASSLAVAFTVSTRAFPDPAMECEMQRHLLGRLVRRLFSAFCSMPTMSFRAFHSFNSRRRAALPSNPPPLLLPGSCR